MAKIQSFKFEIEKFNGSNNFELWNVKMRDTLIQQGVAKTQVGYLRGTTNYCITFDGRSDEVYGYVDSDFAGDLDKRRFTSGYVFTLAGGAISWMSKLQAYDNREFACVI